MTCSAAEAIARERGGAARMGAPAGGAVAAQRALDPVHRHGLHALVFAVVFGLTHKLAMDLLYKEGFADAVKGCPKGHTLCADKKCKEKC